MKAAQDAKPHITAQTPLTPAPPQLNIPARSLFPQKAHLTSDIIPQTQCPTQKQQQAK